MSYSKSGGCTSIERLKKNYLILSSGNSYMSDERGYIMQLGLYKIGYKFYFQVLSPYLLGHQSKYIYSL